MSQTKAQLIDNLVQALNFTGTASAPANGAFLSATNTLALATNSAQRLTIDSSGNVGINQNTPTCQLQVDAGSSGSGTSTALELNHKGNDLNDAIKLNFARAGGDIGSIVLEKVNNNNTTDFIFNTRASNTVSESMRITGAGFLGIGTTSPERQLHVLNSSGDALVRITSADGNAAYLELGDASDRDAGKIVYDNGDNLTFSTANSGSTTEKLRIQGNGNVGIGTTSPSDKLHVRGASAAFTTFILDNATNSSSPYKITFGDQGQVNHLAVANREMTFGTNNAEKMRIDSSGNVGIGTTSPSSLLTLNHATNPSIRFEDSGTKVVQINSEGSSTNIGSFEGKALVFATSTGSSFLERMRIDTSGNVGIGTTSPSRKLEINSGIFDVVAKFVSSDSAATINLVDGLNADGVSIGSINGNMTFRSGLSTERMRIDSSGRVLIGTTSGSDALVVDGGSDAGTILTNSTNGNGNMMTFQCSGTSKFFIGSAGSFITGNSGTTNQGIRAEGHLLFATGGASQTMRLGDNGALGVGGNANRVIHAVQNSSHGTVGVGAFENGDSGNNHAVMFFSTVRDGNGGESFLQCNRDQDNNGQGVSAVAFIRTNGDFDSATNSYGGTSDISLKENIVDAKSQWDDIKNIKVRNFNFKDNPNQKMLGVVAQEIETVCSGLVKETSDEGTTIKTVKYSILYMKAIKGLQEAMARIEVLETEVAALKAA